MTELLRSRLPSQELSVIESHTDGKKSDVRTPHPASKVTVQEQLLLNGDLERVLGSQESPLSSENEYKAGCGQKNLDGGPEPYDKAPVPATPINFWDPENEQVSQGHLAAAQRR